MKLTRRNFLKIGIFSILNLGACKYQKRPKNEWVLTGNKKIFESGKHLITTLISPDEDTNQINVPEGYSIAGISEVTSSFITFTKAEKALYGFKNDVEVEALEYAFYDIYGKEEKREYPFAGKPNEKILKKEAK